MSETDNLRTALRSRLREINNDNPAVIRDEIIAEWESQTGKRLYPGQSDNFILNELAAREANTKTQVNEAVLQQYVRTSTGIFLEELGYPWRVFRLEETRLDDDKNEYQYVEDDDRLRRRILLAPESITNAGTVGAYTFHALGADLAILDVDISNPDDGTGKTHITVLGDGSKPINDLCDAVYQTITDEKIAVLCVNYSVSASKEVHYSIDVSIWIYKNYSEQTVKKAVIKAIEAYVDNPRKHHSILNVSDIDELEDSYKRLGVDIVDSQIIEAIHSVTGVYKVELKNFPKSGIIKVMSGTDYEFGALEKIAEFAVCDVITVNIAGVADE